MHIGILGTGGVGQTLARGFAKKGHAVTLGTRDPAATLARTEPDASGAPPLSRWLEDQDGIDVGTFAEAAKTAEVIVVCVHGTAAQNVVKAAGAKHLAGKLVLDTTNPLHFTESGVHRLPDLEDSPLQRMQALAPDAHFVKAWNCVPGIHMVDPDLPGGPGTQFICGDDEAAKERAISILAEFGWDALDVGDAGIAPYVEAMGLVVINHGVRSGGWDWGLKLLSG